ncbi:uncharacterized protein TM35_000082200 [Trypanosoma theileri]|uniref:Uncharacterized protein n=1 Tax=Trypanosoma theileri TaxID=67003 RepID=A0A1X0P0J1_9TRYP|nr:uncharacterized protein TM35_000082200 [Trypanosoma theileri]ORC90422.1 hypothetical protein TM35_000082200 [Trypanosoma theileri]
MFVQLRRVVYLLVLLQCFVSVAYATCEEDLGGSDKKLGTLRDEAMEHIVKGRACLTELAKNVKTCNESQANATSVAEEAAKSVSELQKWVNEEGSLKDDSDMTTEKITELQEKVKLAGEKVHENEKVVVESATLIQRASVARHSCFASLGNLEAVVKQINDNRLHFDYVFKSGREECLTPERKKLNMDLQTITNESSQMQVNMKWGFRDADDVKKKAVEKIKAAKTIINETFGNYTAIAEKIGAKLGKIKMKEKDVSENTKGLAAIQNSLSFGIVKLKNAVEVSNASANPRRPQPGLLVKPIEETRGNESVTHLVPVSEPTEDPLEKIRAAAATELRVELREAEKKESERMEQEKRAEAERIRLAEEKEEREKAEARQREQEEKRLAKEKEERGKAEARQREEEEKRLAKEKQEREKAEEKEKREKLNEEKLRKAKEEAERAKKAGKDSSSSPSMVSSPFLLLLMCMLGCALVC